MGIMFSGSEIDGAEAIKYQFAEHRKVLNMTGDVHSVEKCRLMFFSKWHKGKSQFVFVLRSGSDLLLLCVFTRVVCVFVMVFHVVVKLRFFLVFGGMNPQVLVPYIVFAQVVDP